MFLQADRLSWKGTSIMLIFLPSSALTTSQGQGRDGEQHVIVNCRTTGSQEHDAAMKEANVILGCINQGIYQQR